MNEVQGDLNVITGLNVEHGGLRLSEIQGIARDVHEEAVKAVESYARNKNDLELENPRTW